jgi:hypothetical protein
MELYPKLQLKLIELTNCDAVKWDTLLHLGFFTKAWCLEKFRDIRFFRSLFYYKLEVNDELHVEKRWTKNSLLSELQEAIRESMARKERRRAQKAYDKTESLKEALYAVECQEKQNE